MTERKETGISRRAFLAGGAVMAAGLLLPKIPGTNNAFLVPFEPEAALADEANGVVGNIMVVNRTQIGIAVGDMGTLDPEKKTIRALADATVTIHSFYNDKEVTGTTDATGKVVFGIDGLAEQNPADVSEPQDSNGKPLEYRFYGSIAVVREGYRDVVIPFMRIKSLSALIAPTRVFEEGKPYLRQLSFDRWDLQYTKASFVSSPINDEDHTFAAEVWVPANKTVKLRLHYAAKGENGNTQTGEIGSTTFGAAGKSAVQSVSFSGKYLCSKQSRDLLPAGCTVYATLECDGATATVTSGLEVIASPFVGNDGGEIETEGEVSIAPDNLVTSANANVLATQDLITEEELNVAAIPSKGVPKPLAGSTFTIWKPTFEHIMFDFSPLGFFLFGVKIGSLNLSYEKDETTNKDSWKREPQQTAKEQFKELRDEQNEQMSKVREMYKPDSTSGKTKKFSADCTREIKVTGGFQMYAQLSYDWDDEEWSGDLNALVGAAVSVSWTIQMVVVFIPVYITFELGGQVSAGLKYAMKSKGGWTPNDIIGNASYDPGSSGPSVALTISIGLTLGVGVAGVLCAYVRGAGYITFKIMYLANSKTGNPRFRLGIGVEATIGVQVFLFSWSGTLWSKDWPGLYDSEPDPESDDEAAAEALLSSGGLTLDENGIPQISEQELARNMSIVTNDALQQSAEFAASGQKVALFANEEPTFVEPVDLGDGNLLWDVPPQGGAGEDGIALFANESPDEYFIYLGESNTEAQLPSADNPKPGEVGIAGVSDDFFGGIKPSVDKLVFKNVFSDPRTKTIYSTMFRVATVNYGDEARTRVVYTTLGDTSWDNPHVIEFDPVFSAGAERVDRQDLYDYEFAVTSLEDSTGSYLYLMIISGSRPDGDKTSFATANSKTVVNVVRLRSLDSQNTSWTCDYAAAFAPSTTGKFVAFSSPNIVSYASSNGYGSCAIGACLVRQANNADKLFSAGAGRWLVSFYLRHQRNGFQIVTQTSKLSWSGSNKLTMGPVTVGTVCQTHIGIVNSNGAFIERLTVSHFDTSEPRIELAAVSKMADHLDVQRLYPTGKDGEFYAVRTDESLFADAKNAGEDTRYRRDARLYLLRFGDDYSFEYVPITPLGSCVPSELTISKDGRYLFYMVNKEGKSSRGFDENGNVGPEKTAEQAAADNSYRVMAMARIGNLFTQPFTLAVLDHPLDYITSMVSKGSTASLVGAEIVDAQNSIANIYDIRVPLAVVGTPLSVVTEAPFAFAGEDTVFDVTVRNDGNTILTGGTFGLYKVTTNADGSETVDPEPVATTDVNFQPNLVVLAEGEDAPTVATYDLAALPDEFAASPLADAADNGLILPGQTLTYKVTFPIPADWASGSAGDGSTSSACKVRVDLTTPHYLDYEGTTMALLADNASGSADGQDADGADGVDNSNTDFDDLTDEEWEEFIYFLMALMTMCEMDPEDWPQTELDVFDGDVMPENFDNLFNAESASGPSGKPGSGDGAGGGGDGDGGPGGGSGAGGGASAHSLADTGDHNFIGKLLFGGK